MAEQTPPIEVLRAARQWAEEHGHQQPDDRMLSVVYAAGRRQQAVDLAATFERITDSETQSLLGTPPEYAAERATRAGRRAAFKRAAEIAGEAAGRG